MPWIRVDDHFDEHPKLAAAGPLAWALWIAGLAYCNRNLTDGFIPWSVAGKLVSWDFLDGGDGPVRIYIGSRDTVGEEGAVTSEYVIMLLLDAGLWDTVKGGYQVHDFDQYQPTKAVIVAERAKKVAAGSAGGIAAATARAKASATAPAVAQSKPVPVPVPNPVSDTDTKASERARDPWDDPEHEALVWLAKHGCDVRPGNGYHRKLVTATEVHGVNAIVGMFDRLAGAGVKHGDIKGFLFGAIDALDAGSRPSLKEVASSDRAEERAADHQRRLERTRRETAELRAAIEETTR